MSQEKRITCPCCDTDEKVKKVQKREIVPVRGEDIEVEAAFYICEACGCDFEPMDMEHDPLDAAYRVYRDLHGLLQPEEIRGIRNRYGLTQKEMSSLLGWGSVTLSRYENGALQDEAHNTTLELIRDEKAFLNLLKKRPHAVSRQKRDRLLAELSPLAEHRCTLPECLTEAVASYPPDIFSGFTSLDLDKVYGAIRTFCTEGCFKTKLNKLLFYADFLHFRSHARSITGLRYAHADHGPVPDDWDVYLAAMQHDKAVRAVEHLVGEYVGEMYYADQTDFAAFAEPEIRTLLMVKDRFATWSAKRIRDYSHQEKAWQETQSGELISYAYAEELQVSG